MNEITQWAEHVTDRAITVEDAQHRIANALEVDPGLVEIEGVYASVRVGQNGIGQVIDYRTEWTFTAAIRP